MSIRGIIVRGPRAVLRRVGLDIVRLNPANANRRRLQALSDYGVSATLDVGAADGEFGQKLRSSGYRGRIVSFEPLRESYAALSQRIASDAGWTAVQSAVGDRDGTVDINVSGRSTSSSVLPMLPSHLRVVPESGYVSVETVPIVRLDSDVPKRLPGDAPLFLKIDVQGFEQSVLAGAVGILQRTAVIEVEVSTLPLYEGGALYVDILGFLAARGFRLISWEDVLTDPRSGNLLQADCILVRNG